MALRFALFGLIMLFFSIFSLIAAGGLSVYAVYAAYVRELPSAEEIGRRSVEGFETTRIYDRTGEHLLYEIIPPDGGRRTDVPLARIPEYLRNATIAMEDKTFYTNPVGINIEGLGRAAWGVLTGENAGGGSSIPQQLIRTVLMTPEERMERSYIRKLKEIILSFELTRRYPGIEGRDQILEWYLNNIFYGHFAYGIQAAAQTYFSKDVEDLSLAEAAMLVPLGQSPALNPIDAPEEAKKRQEIVLDLMVAQGYITAEEAREAKQEELTIAPLSFDIVAPHYVIYVRDLLEERFGSDAVYGGGLQVITAIDLDIQNKAQELAQQQIEEMGEEHNMHNAAVVVLDARTAEILAMVGSVDYNNQEIDGQINMALIPRQPGSSFKPFTYATAFAQGYTPATMVMDIRTSFTNADDPAPYVPENFSRNYHGPITLRRALACSYNIPAVAMMSKVGVQKVLDTAHSMGITDLNAASYGLSLALGAGEVKLLDMVYAFSVFDNGGTMLGERVSSEDYRAGYRQLDPVAILKVTDARGRVLYEYKEPQRQEVIRPEVAFLITNILSDNQARTPAFGSDNHLILKDRPVAAKTGTTNDYYDGWIIGYTPQYVTGVWVGNTDHEKMIDGEAAYTAAPIWQNLMEWLHDGLPVEGFTRPDGIVTAVVDAVSGKLPTEYSTSRIQEIFIQGTVPTDYDDIHRAYQICKVSGKLATPYCPPEEVETQVFEVYPAGAEDWVREQGIPQPPTEYCDVHGPSAATQDIVITSPKEAQSVRGVLSIMGNVKSGDMQNYWLEYGEGLNPETWTRIGGDHNNRVENNVLETWDTTGMDGLYTLRLNVMTGSGLQQYTTLVTVDNTPPTVTFLSPWADKKYSAKQDEWVNIQVDVQDNISMDRVEFYLDGELLGFSTVSPYTLRWTIVGGGSHEVYVIAYDAAGNETQSEPVKFSVGP